ncbi:MAG TPA: hypothetical protein VMT16_11545 [Thermoanaerobaculia bacterium]|nr:hypothetical protein [Thermoanaerobaculia bacterium]
MDDRLPNADTAPLPLPDLPAAGRERPNEPPPPEGRSREGFACGGDRLAPDQHAAAVQVGALLVAVVLAAADLAVAALASPGSRKRRMPPADQMRSRSQKQ